MSKVKPNSSGWIVLHTYKHYNRLIDKTDFQFTEPDRPMFIRADKIIAVTKNPDPCWYEDPDWPDDKLRNPRHTSMITIEGSEYEWSVWEDTDTILERLGIRWDGDCCVERSDR